MQKSHVPYETEHSELKYGSNSNSKPEVDLYNLFCAYVTENWPKYQKRRSSCEIFTFYIKAGPGNVNIKSHFKPEADI